MTKLVRSIPDPGHAATKDLYNYDRFPKAYQRINGRTELVGRQAYGHTFNADWNDAQIELWCAGERLSVEEGGLGEFGHYKNAIQLMFPYMKAEWHHWLDMQLDAFCGESGTFTMLGGSGLGKSWYLGTMSRVWQAARPLDRLVIIINTTQKTQSDRAWKYVGLTQNKFPWLGGKMNESKRDPKLSIYEPVETVDGGYEWKIKPGIGIISQTVKSGTSAKATQDIKGYHAKEILFVIEETNHLNRAHLQRARANWIGNPFYKILLVGNPEIEDSVEEATDALYHFSEPVHGWSTITWGETFQWHNKYGGKTYHFDPYDSPRVHEPEKYKISIWLPSSEYISTKAKELGGTNTSLFKQQVRGIYDHSSLPFNPITFSMCDKYKVRESASFTGHGIQRWAAFDPAFSGNDEAYLKIAQTGLVEEGYIAIDFLGPDTGYVFQLDGDNPQEPSFQMLHWVQDILKKHGVPPENFIMDANVIGIALGDIFTKFLSKKINKVTVMGQPSDRWMDLEETYRAKDRCANKQTELWIGMQQLIISGQVRGLDDSIIGQLIEMPAFESGGKVKVLDKKSFRRRFGYSPDKAETCLFIVDLLRERGFKNKGLEEMVDQDLNAPVLRGIGEVGAENIFINKAPRPYIHGGVQEYYKSGSVEDTMNKVMQAYKKSTEVW